MGVLLLFLQKSAPFLSSDLSQGEQGEPKVRTPSDFFTHRLASRCDTTRRLSRFFNCGCTNDICLYYALKIAIMQGMEGIMGSFGGVAPAPWSPPRLEFIGYFSGGNYSFKLMWRVAGKPSSAIGGWATPDYADIREVEHDTRIEASDVCC
jgi:hypothetical protein